MDKVTAREYVVSANSQGAKTILVKNEKDKIMAKEALDELGLSMTVRLPIPGSCFVCHEYHEDFERDCHPPTAPW